MAASTTSLIAAAIETSEQPDPSGTDSPRLDGRTDVDGRTARRIAAVIGRMISAGTLDIGSRLPTVRELSRRLGVSPTTVSEAWRSLANVGAIETRGRNGTYVRRPTGPGGPRRYRQVTEGPGHFALDLSSGTPDPLLLPDLAPIVARVGRQSLTSSYLDQPVLPELAAEIETTWPFTPAALTVVDGALDALDRVATEVLRLGDRVIVEHPTFPPILDLLDRLDCEAVERRRRRRGSGARPAPGRRRRPTRTATSIATARRWRCSSNRAPTTPPASRCRRAGRRRSPASWPGRTRSSSRTTTRTTSRRRRS